MLDIGLPSFTFSCAHDTAVRGSTPPSPPQSPPRQHTPRTPSRPPQDWEGPPPKFAPASPDHPPPGWQTNSGKVTSPPRESDYSPRSPGSPYVDEVFAPQSPTPPPPDVDSDTDDMYDSAIAAARSAVSPEVWEALSPDTKKAHIDRQMEILIKASKSSSEG